MSFPLFVARRYLLARRKQAFISVISLISVLGVALGVASLIVVLGVMNGFSADLRNKILGVNAHVLVSSVGQGMENYAESARKVAALPEVVAVTPFIYSEVMASTTQGVKGVVLRGIDPVGADKVLSISRDLESGSLADLGAESGPPRIIVGKELAERLGLRLNSLVNLLSPTGRQSAAGFTPKISAFRVAGIFKTGLFEYDSSLAYVTIPAAQELLGFKSDLVTGLELRVKDVERADVVATAVRQALGGFPLYVRHWKEMNANLFAALKLEKTAMAIILVMIVLVGSFSIITTLVMLVMEKTRDIAILRSMGASAAEIRNIFMLQGTIIGVVGTVLGFALGLAVCFLLKRYQFIELPHGVYSLDRLPVLLSWVDLVSIGVAAFALCFAATLYPARQAARLNPSEALRHE
jgi:lipoprotein-releasing system permease protein